jgi:spore coat protein U-like protein
MMRILLSLAVTISSMTLSSPINAQSCNFTLGNVNFGNIDVTANTTFTASATLSISCTGGNSRNVRVCPSIGSGTGGANASTRWLVNGATQMTFNLFQNNTYTTIWGSYFWAFAARPPTIDLRLPPAGSGTASATVYARVAAGQTTLPAATYSSAFSGTNTAFAYAYRNVGTCSVIGSSNATQVPFTATARNVATCRVTAADLNFGSVSNLTGNHDANGSASVTCTNQSPYRVLLSNGLTGTGPTNRKMTLGANSVTYGLYRDAGRTLPWGNTSGVDSLSGTGSGFAQTIDIYGRVPPQSVPPPGAYQDTIVMTVEY